MVFFGGVGDHNTCGILAPRPGIELARLALKGKVLTTGPPGKSLDCFLIKRRGSHTCVSKYCWKDNADYSLKKKKKIPVFSPSFVIIFTSVSNSRCLISSVGHTWYPWQWWRSYQDGTLHNNWKWWTRSMCINRVNMDACSSLQLSIYFCVLTYFKNANYVP